MRINPSAAPVPPNAPVLASQGLGLDFAQLVAGGGVQTGPAGPPLGTGALKAEPLSQRGDIPAQPKPEQTGPVGADLVQRLVTAAAPAKGVTPASAYAKPLRGTKTTDTLSAPATDPSPQARVPLSAFGFDELGVFGNAGVDATSGATQSATSAGQGAHIVPATSLAAPSDPVIGATGRAVVTSAAAASQPSGSLSQQGQILPSVVSDEPAPPPGAGSPTTGLAAGVSTEFHLSAVTECDEAPAGGLALIPADKADLAAPSSSASVVVSAVDSGVTIVVGAAGLTPAQADHLAETADQAASELGAHIQHFQINGVSIGRARGRGRS